MKGIIVSLDEARQLAIIKTSLSPDAPLSISYEIIEGGKEALFIGLELELRLSPKREIARAIPSQKMKEPDNLQYLKVTRSIEECIFSYFNNVKILLSRFKINNTNSSQIDFLRIRRFLLTAYNDLYELDNSVYDTNLEQLRRDLGRIQKEYEAFKKKITHPIKYAYEKIFLHSQSGYLKLEEKAQFAQSILTSSILKEKPMAERLREKEKRLINFEDKKSIAYANFEREVKELRKRYVDLLHTISLEREALQELNGLIKTFQERYFQEFVDIYQPLSTELERRILWLLNTKAYELDSTLWDRAKQSKLIRQFFVDSGITGTYSSKTFLKYYLRSLDQDKLRNENKELFSLLSYLESISKKNISIIRHRYDLAIRCKQLLENFDKDLNLTIVKDPLDALKLNDTIRPDIILLDMELNGITPFEFVQKYRLVFGSEGTNTLFCLFVNELTGDLLSQAKKAGIKHFLRTSGDDDEFIDSMRTIL